MIIRCSFLDLLDKLERINIYFVELAAFKDYIYMDPKNEYNYKISEVINDNETYRFQYLCGHSDYSGNNNIYNDIPNAIFYPDHNYDFELDIENKKFKKFDEYKLISLNEIKHTIINMQIEENKLQKNKSLFKKIFGC